MSYLIVYCIFAYLIVLGQILGELAIQVKLVRFHIIVFILAPVFLPVYVGYWSTQVMNLGDKEIVKP